MNAGLSVFLLLLLNLAGVAPIAHAQETKLHRVGVILAGRPNYAGVDGLREGLKELRLEEGKQYVLDIQDVKGDLKAVGQVAANFERGKMDLLYTISTSVTTRAKQATTTVPMVFTVGGDPVARGLVESFPKPGGRLTGVYYWTTDLSPKRLEALKDILPKLRRVVTFYDPKNPIAQHSAKAAQEAGRHLGIKILERHVASVGELEAALRALRAGEADAVFLVTDTMAVSHAQLIIDAANAKGLPTMVHEYGLVAEGALAGYGMSYREVSRMSAKYVQRVLAGTDPKDLPVERYDRISLAINLRTAKALGLRIPNSVLDRADQVIQ